VTAAERMTAWILGAAVAVAAGVAVLLGRGSRKLQKGASVLLIGDSHAVGLDHHLAGNLGAALAACGLDYLAVPVGGTGAPYWAAKLPALMGSGSTRPWDVVLISVGGNDFRRTDPVAVLDAVRAIVATAKSHGARLIWLEPTIMPFADKINVRGMWADTGVERFPTLDLEPLPRVADQIHLTWDGYKTWVAALADYLCPAA